MRRKSNSANKEAKTMKRFGAASWSGSLRDGKGAVSTESQAMTNRAKYQALTRARFSRSQQGLRPAQSAHNPDAEETDIVRLMRHFRIWPRLLIRRHFRRLPLKDPKAAAPI
jgi:hypothetical protein